MVKLVFSGLLGFLLQVFETAVAELAQKYCTRERPQLTCSSRLALQKPVACFKIGGKQLQKPASETTFQIPCQVVVR